MTVVAIEVNNLDQLVVEIAATISTREPRQRGTETLFLCPSHNDRNPSARWNPEKRVWYCDACGDGGGAIDLAAKLGVN